jgi:Metal-dependent hydrolase
VVKPAVTRRQTSQSGAAPRAPVRKLHVCTYNIHKGFSQFKARMMIHELRRRLHSLGPDIVFLQEVQGLHAGHAGRHLDWPEEGQHDFLADGVWPDTAYGGNAIYDHGHHGNAILSRFPILPRTTRTSPS